jgi:hypothetical protein
MCPDVVVVFQIHFWYWQWWAPIKTSTEVRCHRWIWKRTYMVVHPTRWHVSRFGSCLPDSLLMLAVMSNKRKTSTELRCYRWIWKRTYMAVNPTRWHVSRFGSYLPDSLWMLTVTSTNKKTSTEVGCHRWIWKRTYMVVHPTHLSVKCTGLSLWKWSWQSPDVVHSPEVQWIVLNCQYSPLSSFGVEYWTTRACSDQ